MNKIQNEIMLDMDDISNIAITCKCGNRFVEKVPRFLLTTNQRVVARCTLCTQAYGIANKKIVRLTFDLHPDKWIEPSSLSVDGEIDSATDTDTPALEGKIIGHGSNEVN